jgi:hypothetical protein
MSLEKSIQKLTNVIQAAAKIDRNTTPIEYGPDGQMRPKQIIQGACVTQQVATPDENGNITRTYQCMCFYDKANGKRCVVRRTPGLCGNDEGPKIIPPDMPCINS